MVQRFMNRAIYKAINEPIKTRRHGCAIHPIQHCLAANLDHEAASVIDGTLSLSLVYLQGSIVNLTSRPPVAASDAIAPGETASLTVGILSSASRVWLPPNSTLGVLVRIFSASSPETVLTMDGLILPPGWALRDLRGQFQYRFTAGAEGAVMTFSPDYELTLPLKLVAGTVPGEVRIAVAVTNSAIPETTQEDNEVVGTLTLVRARDAGCIHWSRSTLTKIVFGHAPIGCAVLQAFNDIRVSATANPNILTDGRSECDLEVQVSKL